MSDIDSLDLEVPLGTVLETRGAKVNPIAVRLSRELITLLSEQLYTSPTKAIEELVVNSFDADADSCWVFVPAASPGTDFDDLHVIAVFDDGVGMDETGLSDLWRVGASSKREEQTQRLRKRTQIGKFGIGKLATYALASRITYITCTGEGEILSVSLSFDSFASSDAGESDTPVELQVIRLAEKDLMGEGRIRELMAANRLDPNVALSASAHWTLVLLEEFKPRVERLSVKRLRWVLSTAMPLSEFRLHLNGDEVESSKAAQGVVVEFEVGDLPRSRLERINAKSSLQWERMQVQGEGPSGLKSSLLPSGVRGTVMVSSTSLYGGKSADLIRSHGFFIRVRNRLISEDDPLFGVQPLSYEVFNRFRADLEVDDLDADLTAPREGTGSTDRVSALQDLLIELFNEARARWEKAEKERFKQETKREDQRNYVNPRFVERPFADALVTTSAEDDGESGGSDADDSWFYMKQPPPEDLPDIVEGLYETTERDPFQFRLEESGREARLVVFDPVTRTFEVNADHDLALAYKDTPQALDLLYDLAAAESLLETYLREVGLAPNLVGEVLERRDGLFRSLARERVNSPAAIAASLRDATASERDLEIAMVVAARALGFVAKHIGNAGRADGIARFTDYPTGNVKITLEAKSSADEPSLGALDFAGLQQHKNDENAVACLLIAPQYPGGSQGDNAAAAKRAKELKISCWTINQLAEVVGAIATRDITARHVLAIVLNHFTPEDVTHAIDELLADTENAPRELAVHMLAALRTLEKTVPVDRVRSLDMISPELGRQSLQPSQKELKIALQQLAGASSGAISILQDGERFHLNTSVEELERRVEAWAHNGSSTRRGSTFHESPLPGHTRPGLEVD
ncbi:ATP-binding protein [Humibacter ginsenosidimutans]|uniref:ATP-binding protein n=1 Tax=Humibacter ginsenosidimutans TaxID=2599293 RepID=A0A5B8M690_9MICO|nr:ATP-binding protein [Humibacter ginsenosidimutans]QDZ15873.1 hypothetical protein FPZ11_14815 [Humibacter ginsenosidimutans]